MNKKTLIFAAIFLVSVAALVMLYRKNVSLREDVDRLSHNMTIVAEPLDYYKTDRELVAKHEALQAKYSELAKQHLADTKLIKELNVRLKDTKAIHTISVASVDTIYLEPTTINQDTLIAYTDKWISLSVNVPQRQCVYETRDSLTTVVSRAYKHHFLWWRWGTKGYEVQIVNHNPHSKVRYSRYVEVVE